MTLSVRDWHKKNLENCIDKIIYTNKIHKRDFLESGNFPIVSQEDGLINGYWNRKEDIFHVSTPLVAFGDHTQVLKYIDFDFVLGADGVKLLLPKQFLYPKYFYYYLTSINFRSLGYARHYRHLREIEIVYPASISEQKRIVKILDEAFEKLDIAKKNTEKNLQNTKVLFESYLNNIFSKPGKDWEEKVLGDLCVFENGDRGKNYPAKSKLHTDGIPFVTAGNIDKHDILLEGKNYVSDKQYNLLSRGKFIRGDILFCLRGSLGKFALVKSVEYGAIASSLVIIRPKKEIIGNFLCYYFQSGLCRDMIKKYKGGAAQPNLGAQDVKKFDICIPSLSEQEQIVKKLDQLSENTQKLESLYKLKLDNIEELKKSILQKAFSGEL